MLSRILLSHNGILRIVLVVPETLKPTAVGHSPFLIGPIGDSLGKSFERRMGLVSHG